MTPLMANILMAYAIICIWVSGASYGVLVDKKVPASEALITSGVVFFLWPFFAAPMIYKKLRSHD